MTHPSARMHTLVCTRTKTHACMRPHCVIGVGKHMLTQPRKEEHVLFVYNCKAHYTYFCLKQIKRKHFRDFGLESNFCLPGLKPRTDFALTCFTDSTCSFLYPKRLLKWSTFHRLSLRKV